MEKLSFCLPIIVPDTKFQIVERRRQASNHGAIGLLNEAAGYVCATQQAYLETSTEIWSGRQYSRQDVAYNATLANRSRMASLCDPFRCFQLQRNKSLHDECSCRSDGRSVQWSVTQKCFVTQRYLQNCRTTPKFGYMLGRDSTVTPDKSLNLLDAYA